MTLTRRLTLKGLALLLLTALPWLASAQTLTTTVDRDTLTLNETLTLTLRYTGSQVRREPDFSILNAFDVLSNQKSMQHSVINGNVSAATEWRLILSPRATGQLLIPPFSVDGQSSLPLTIHVQDAVQNPQSGHPDVFLETYIDKATAHVQEQILVTFRLHYNQSVESLDMPPLQLDQVRIEALPRVDYQKTLGHTRYGVAEFRYALFADASGAYRIPEQTWSLRTTDNPGGGRFGFNSGRLKVHRARTKALDLTVLPRPDAFPAGQPWLPAESVTLEEHWGRPPEQFQVGEPITRTVTLRAQGVGPEQLPPLFDNVQYSDFRLYADAPRLDKSTGNQGLLATRIESLAIVPSRAGELTLPAVSVTWWNSARQRVEVAQLPERTVTVAPAPGAPAESTGPAMRTASADASTTPPAQGANPVWFWLCLALLLSNCALALLLFRFWRRASLPHTQDPSHNPPAGRQATQQQAQHALQQACRQKDPVQVRKALMQWAQARWPEQAQSSLDDLIRLIATQPLSDDGRFAAALRQLDAHLYARAGDTQAPTEPDYDALAAGVAALSQPRRPQQAEQALQPLYRH